MENKMDHITTSIVTPATPRIMAKSKKRISAVD
jgi:hypothetical protein